MNVDHHINTIAKGLFGTIATTGTVAVSFMQTLELYLRLAGLVVGLAIGIVTLLSVWRDYKRKN